VTKNTNKKWTTTSVLCNHVQHGTAAGTGHQYRMITDADVT